jgi:hypothetical protein
MEEYNDWIKSKFEEAFEVAFKKYMLTQKTEQDELNFENALEEFWEKIELNE